MRRLALAALAAVTCAAVGASLFYLLQPSPPKAKAQPVPNVHRLPPAPLRVATWNIHAGVGTDRKFDLDRTTETLRDLRADVIGLQEVDVHWGERSEWRNEAREIADALDMEVFFAPIYTFGPPEDGKPLRRYGLAILSRYPIVYAENHEITQRRWDRWRRRSGFPEVVLNVQGRFVHFYTTHLGCCNQTVRETQITEMLRVLSRDGRHPQQILVGDLNAPPDAPELEPLWDVGLVDTWHIAGHGPGSTRADKRIDYIATSRDIDVTRTEVAETDESASDHLPVVADVVLEGSYVRTG